MDLVDDDVVWTLALLEDILNVVLVFTFVVFAVVMVVVGFII